MFQLAFKTKPQEKDEHSTTNLIMAEDLNHFNSHQQIATSDSTPTGSIFYPLVMIKKLTKLGLAKEFQGTQGIALHRYTTSKGRGPYICLIFASHSLQANMTGEMWSVCLLRRVRVAQES